MSTQILTLNWTRGSEQIAVNVSITDDGSIDVDTTVPGTTTDKEVDIALDVSKLSLIYISSDKAITIETNVAGSPVESIAVAADKPVVWYSGCGLTCPLLTDVTKLFLTNAGSTTATVKMRFLQDVTA